WEWRRLDATRAEGAFIFDPPIGKVQPVSFRTERHVFNGVTFTRAERLDATNNKDTEESARFSLRHVYDAGSLQITLPETRFPSRFRITAWEKGQPADHGGSGRSAQNAPEGLRRNDRESAFAGEGLTAWPETRNVTLTLPKPLPGVTYEINWELPD